MSGSEFDSAEPWSVEYGDLVYDDARKVGDLWYYRDPLINEILRFAYQDWVILLHQIRHSAVSSRFLGY
jgi:hypothetical protein